MTGARSGASARRTPAGAAEAYALPQVQDALRQRAPGPGARLKLNIVCYYLQWLAVFSMPLACTLPQYARPLEGNLGYHGRGRLTGIGAGRVRRGTAVEPGQSRPVTAQKNTCQN
jgi:hypothetical protein